jgi:hypothetical protein
MHTVISTFTNRHDAQRAMELLQEQGIAGDDMHLQQGGSAPANNAGIDRATWDGMEREVAVDRGVLSSVGHFFASLFGQDNPNGHVDTYSRAVEQGGCVVVLDARDEAQAREAARLLDDLGGQTSNVVHRATQKPLREIVGGRRDQGGQIDRGERTPLRDERSERAFAFGGEQRPLDLRDPDDARHAPGLRYADKDKPDR